MCVSLFLIFGGGVLTCSGSFGPFVFAGGRHGGWHLGVVFVLGVGFRHVGFWGTVGLYLSFGWQVLYVFYLFSVMLAGVPYFTGVVLVGFALGWGLVIAFSCLSIEFVGLCFCCLLGCMVWRCVVGVYEFYVLCLSVFA